MTRNRLQISQKRFRKVTRQESSIRSKKNRVIIIISTVAVLVALGLFLVLKQLGVQRHLKAGQMFTEALTNRNIEGLDKVVSEFKGSISAGNALLAKADIQIDQGKSQDAIATLTEMADGFTDHPRHAQAFYMLGNIYHKSGDIVKARENYNRVLEIQTDGELSPISRIRLGDLELAEGNEDKARQHYEDSYTQHPGSPFVVTAERRLAQLKVGNPPEVDPPKPPAPEKEEETETPKPTPGGDETSGKGEKAEEPKGGSKGDKGKGKGKAKSEE